MKWWTERRRDPRISTGFAVILISIMFLIVAALLLMFPGWPRFLGLLFGLWAAAGVGQGIAIMRRDRRKRS
ncbi:MAG: hypothetical protein ACR2GA_03110 [Chloroflexota bacterium]